MEHSLFKDFIGTKELDTYLQDTPWGNYFFPNFFPFKYTPFLKYETLIGSKGRSVMADVVAYNTSAPEKKRPIVSKLTGDIPSMRVKRAMDEVKLKEYDILKGQASAPEQALLDIVFDDVDFVTQGPLARVEWMTFQAMSQGYIALSETNNQPGIITTTNIDFQMPAANKRVLATATATRKWNNGTSSNYLPITDIRDLVLAARSAGKKFKYAVMNYTNWLLFSAADEVKNQVWPYMGQNTVISSSSVPLPTLDAVNAYLRSQMLPEIILIDQSLYIEDSAHSQTAADPWVTKYVTFIPDKNIGENLYTPSAEELNKPPQVIQAKKGPILVSKWSDVDPTAEYTKGELNAFPSWPSIDSCYRLDTILNAADGLDD